MRRKGSVFVYVFLSLMSLGRRLDEDGFFGVVELFNVYPARRGFLNNKVLVVVLWYYFVVLSCCEVFRIVSCFL